MDPVFLVFAGRGGTPRWRRSRSQLDHAGISWKAYLQALPHPDYQGICYPAKCKGAPDSDPLYVSKHDGIQNYTTSHNPFDFSRQVPIDQLARDLRSGAVALERGPGA